MASPRSPHQKRVCDNPGCGIMFQPRSGIQAYCSSRCQIRAAHLREFERYKLARRILREIELSPEHTNIVQRFSAAHGGILET